VIDEDGEATTMAYSSQGDLLTTTTSYGDVTSFTRNAIGEAVALTTHAQTSTPGVITLTLMPGVGVASSIASTSASAPMESKLYYDRFGFLAVAQHKNLNSLGQLPTKHVPSGGQAREWVEEQFIYQFTRLMDVYQDRQPLDEAPSASRFLAVHLNYEVDGRLTSITHPNGSVSTFDFDGYGTLYQSHIRDAGNTQSVSSQKTFINPLLEVTATYQKSGSDQLWTIIDRNAAGAVVKVTEPSTTAPSGYTGSTGGAIHEYDLDNLGRVTEARTKDGATVLLTSRAHYDELSRLIWRESADVSSNASQALQTRWQYANGKGSQLERTQSTGVGDTTYTYLSGRLITRTDAAGNSVALTYVPSTALVDTVSTTLQGSPSLTMESTYGYDKLGQIISITQHPAASLNSPLKKSERSSRPA